MPDPHVHSFITSLKQASQPALSLDGQRVATIVTEIDAETLKPRASLWTIAVDGTDRRVHDHGFESVGSPAWDAAGAHLFVAASKFGDSEGEIHLVYLDSGDTQKVPSRGKSPHTLVASPSGRHLAYVSRVEGAGSASRNSDLPPVRVVTRLDYKEDGHGLPNDSHDHIQLTDLETGAQTTLTSGRFDHGALGWSPDGRTLGAIRRTRVGLSSQLLLVDIDSLTERVIGRPEDTVRAWGWSLDGASILFFSSPHPEIDGDFYLLDVASGASRRLTTGLPWAIDFPHQYLSWVDDHRVAVLGFESGRSGIWTVDAETGATERIVLPDAAHVGLAGAPGSSTVVFSASTATVTGELHALDLEFLVETPLTHLNDSWLAQHPPARIDERFAQNEGLTVPYLVKTPHDFDAAGRYPVIVEVHGGPHMFRGFEIEPSNQLFVDDGFLVVCPNPRGSISYGLDYAKGVLGDWGGGDWRDILAVVDEVARLPYVDPERIAIYGYSYGGYMTSWAIGQTDRFKAAVIGAPLTNLVSRVGTSDIGFATSWLEYDGDLPDIRDRLLGQSPVWHMHKAVTPTLLLHPEEDQRCHIEQSEQLFEGLMRAGVTTAFVRYPGQSHLMPWTGPAEYRIDFYTRILDWFRTHV